MILTHLPSLIRAGDCMKRALIAGKVRVIVLNQRTRWGMEIGTSSGESNVRNNGRIGTFQKYIYQGRATSSPYLCLR